MFGFIHSKGSVTWENGSWRFASFPPEFGQVNKKNLYWKVPLKHGVWNESCLGVTSPESIRWLLSPSQLLQAPAPWLPYMRDQGLPRCSGERRAQCETGQPGPQNTHFLCVLGALVGFQMGSVTQATPHLFLMESVAFSRGLWAPSNSIQLHSKFVR